MGEMTEQLKTIAQLRKAIAPLVEIIKADADGELTKRLDTIEKALTALASREVNVQVPAPIVKVDVPTEAIERLVKDQGANMQKYVTGAVSVQEYQPHDQVKKGTFQYSGFVKSDGSYYIQRVAKGEQRYYMGKGDYGDAWERKGDLKYGYIDATR